LSGVKDLINKSTTTIIKKAMIWVGGLKPTLLAYIKKTNIYLILLGPIILGLLIISIIPSVIIMVTHEKISDKALSFICSISSFIMGLSGFFQIIRKESPGIFSKYLKNIPSIINGICVMVVFWLLSLVFIILIFM
jgi:hypothetical protein